MDEGHPEALVVVVRVDESKQFLNVCVFLR